MMFLLRRALCFLAAAIAALPGGAQSQAYPVKPIRVIISFAPGGSLDLVARLLAPRMAESMGQPVVAENRAGAGGSIGAEAVAHAAPDGYTILFTTPSTHVIGRFLNKSLPYDPARDFTPITMAVDTMLSIAAHASFAPNSFAELLQYAKRNPGKVVFGTSGVGTAYHFAGEEIRMLTGVPLVHVPYKGSGPSLADALAGQIPVIFTGIENALPHVRTGKLKFLAVIDSARYARMPGLPAVGESIPGFVKPPSWHGYFGPAGLPQPVATRLREEVVKAMQLPEVRARLDASYIVVVGDTPEQFRAKLASQVDTMGRIAQAAGIKPE